MKKSKLSIMFILCLLIGGMGFSSCTDDDNNIHQYQQNFDNIFKSLKSNYTGTLTLPDNTTKTQKLTIGDVTSNGVTNTMVQVSNFPMEAIFAKLYPNEWHQITLKEPAAYAAPIDSVGYQTTVMNFKTDDDRTEQLEFSYTLNGETHNGWANVSTVGMYSNDIGLLNIYFNVYDLVIDNEDKQSLTPIYYEMTMQKQ